MKTVQLIFILAICIAIAEVDASYQTVNWPQITDIKSGDHKLLL
jgi:hypothetical protein